VNWPGGNHAFTFEAQRWDEWVSSAGRRMSSLDMPESQAEAAPSASGVGLEKLGLWLMAAYWLALVGIFAAGGMASGS
jgi:hypothetical protein